MLTIHDFHFFAKSKFLAHEIFELYDVNNYCLLFSYTAIAFQVLPEHAQ